MYSYIELINRRLNKIVELAVRAVRITGQPYDNRKHLIFMLKYRNILHLHTNLYAQTSLRTNLSTHKPPRTNPVLLSAPHLNRPL